MPPPAAKPSLLAQILAPLAGFFFFAVGMSFLPTSWGPEFPGLGKLLQTLAIPVPFAFSVIAYAVVHRIFDGPLEKGASRLYRISTSPEHFVWCIFEPLVLGSTILSYYLPRHAYYTSPELNAVVAFGTHIAPLLLLANALPLRRKSPTLAVISVITVLGTLVTLTLPIIT